MGWSLRIENYFVKHTCATSWYRNASVKCFASLLGILFPTRTCLGIFPVHNCHLTSVACCRSLSQFCSNQQPIQTAKALTKLNRRIILGPSDIESLATCRNLGKANPVADEIRSASNSNVEAISPANNICISACPKVMMTSS